MSTFDQLNDLLSRKADLQVEIEKALACLPQVKTPELYEFERGRHRGTTPEGLVLKISDSGIVFDVWHDQRYYGRFKEADAKQVLRLATMERAVA